MPVNIDPNFSVYGLLTRIQQESAVLRHRRTMSLISYEIENATLIDKTQTRVFSAFQKMSRFMRQAKRYEQLAQTAESVYVFGIPDVTPPQIPNVTYVYLNPKDQLAKEWFLVSYGRGYASTLATEELTHMDDPDDTRIFKGLWSFDLRLTAILEEWLSHTVDAPPLLISENEHNAFRQSQIVNNIMHRLTLKVTADKNPRQAALIQDELKSIIKDTIYPAIAQGEGQKQPHGVYPLITNDHFAQTR